MCIVVAWRDNDIVMTKITTFNNQQLRNEDISSPPKHIEILFAAGAILIYLPDSLHFIFLPRSRGDTEPKKKKKLMSRIIT